MGQVTNPIAMHLALTTLWRYLFVGDFGGYKEFTLSAFIIKKICKNFFSTYSIPETIISKPRNDKTLEQKERNLQSSLIPNSFAINNMIHGNTTVIKEKGLLVTVDILDADLLAKKVNEIKDFKKVESSYLLPKPWKRRLAQSLMQYITLLRNIKNFAIKKYISPRRKLKRIIAKSFRWCFRAKNIMKNLKHYDSKKKHFFWPKEKIFFRPKHYILRKKKNLEYYDLALGTLETTKEDKNDNENNEDNETKLRVESLDNFSKRKTQQKALYFSSHCLRHIEKFEFVVKCKFKFLWNKLLDCLKTTMGFAVLVVKKKKKLISKKNIGITSKEKENGTFSKKKKVKAPGKTLSRCLSKIKRYPLIFQTLFKKQKNALQIAPNELPWALLKSLICSFSIINKTEKNKKNFWYITWKNILSMLWRFIYNIPQTICSRMLTSMIVNVESQMITQRSNFFAERYLIYQISYASLFAAVSCIYKNSNLRFSFVGKHTRNMSAKMLVNYIVTKLGQYFTVQEIVKPITYDLKTSPFFCGFKLMVVGRVTRKERAAFILKQFGNLPLNKFSAKIDYAAESKIMKFGMVGIKVLLNQIKINSSYYTFNFRNLETDVINFWLLSAILKSKFGYMPKEIRYKPRYVSGYRYYHSNSPWKHGVPKGLPGIQELKKKYKKLFANNETQLTHKEWVQKELEEQKTRFVAKYNLLLFSKEHSAIKHLLAVKDFDDEYCIVSHVCTSVSMIIKNPLQKGFLTEYLAETNFKGENKPQYYYHEIRLMLKSELHFVNQEQFDIDSKGLLYQPNVKLIYDNLGITLDLRGRQAFAYRFFHEKNAQPNFTAEELQGTKEHDQDIKKKTALLVHDETLTLIVADKFANSPAFYDLVTVKVMRRLGDENINFRLWLKDFMSDMRKETSKNTLENSNLSPSLTKKMLLLQDVVRDVLGELYAASKTPEEYIDGEYIQEKPSSILEAIVTKGKQPILNKENKNIINDD